MSLLHVPMRDVYLHHLKPQRQRNCSPLLPADYLIVIAAAEKFWRSGDQSREDQPMTPAVWKEHGESLLARYLDSRSDLSPPTVNKHLRYLRTLWNFLHAEDVLPKRFRLQETSELKREPRCWSQLEFTAILRSAMDLRGKVGDVPSNVWWPALILVMYAVGCRINAIMRIAVADLDLEAGTVLVRAETQKQKDDQLFTLIPEAVAALRLMRPDRLALVFEEWTFDQPNAKTGRRDWRTLTRHYRKILQRAGLPDSRRDLFHKVRRTFGTFIAAAAGRGAAKELLGHSTEKVTERYLDKRFLALPNAAELLQRPSVPIQLRLLPPDEPPAARVG